MKYNNINRELTMVAMATRIMHHHGNSFHKPMRNINSYPHIKCCVKLININVITGNIQDLRENILVAMVIKINFCHGNQYHKILQ